MSSAQFAVEKLQRVFFVKEAELDSIIARAQQRVVATADLDVSQFASTMVSLESSSPDEQVTKIESDRAQDTASTEALKEKLSAVMKDVKARCHNL